MPPSLVHMNRTISHIAAALTYVIKRLQTNRRKANKALSEALGQLEEVDSFNDEKMADALPIFTTTPWPLSSFWKLWTF